MAEYCHNSCSKFQPFSPHTCAKTSTPLVNCIVNDGLVNAMPIQFINVMHPRQVDLLLDDAPHLVGLVDRVWGQDCSVARSGQVRWGQDCSVATEIRLNESRRCLLEKSYGVRFSKIRTQFSQGSAATHWTCGGKCYMGFVGNLVDFQQWKNFENPLRLTKLSPWVWSTTVLGHSVAGFLRWHLNFGFEIFLAQHIGSMHSTLDEQSTNNCGWNKLYFTLDKSFQQ